MSDNGNPNILIVTGERMAGAGELARLPVELISDGQAALERLQQGVPALVALDVEVDGLSGLEIWDWMRGDPRFAATRVVLLIADVMCIHGAGAQPDAVLMKPFTARELVDVIETVL